MTTTVLANAVLFDGRTPELRDGVAVVVEDGRIRDIAATTPSLGDARTIDLRGRTLMPGLIDAHFHAIAADANLARLEHMPRA